MGAWRAVSATGGSPGRGGTRGMGVAEGAWPARGISGSTATSSTERARWPRITGELRYGVGKKRARLGCCLESQDSSLQYAFIKKFFKKLICSKNVKVLLGLPILSRQSSPRISQCVKGSICNYSVQETNPARFNAK